MRPTPVPLAAASDMAQSLAFSEQRLINLYPETSALGGKSKFTLIGTPGLKLFCTAGSGPFRGGIFMADFAYVVSGQQLWRIASNGSTALMGTVPGNGFVSMAKAGTQIAIAASENKGFIFDSTTGLTIQITDVDFFGCTSVSSLDGYFIWGSGTDYVNRFQISALKNGFSYDALDFASAESTATPLLRVFLVGTQLFMMKTDRIEVWYNSGDASFPFAQLNNTIIAKGLGAQFSPALLDNTVYWLGVDDDGGGTPVVYRVAGYTAEVISTRVVSQALGMVTDLTKVIGISYTKDNHAFYGLILPSGNAWFYDVTTGLWHERQTYGLGRWLGTGHVEAYGKTLIGSFIDGALYELDLSTYFDAATLPIVREATLPTFGTDPELKRCSRLRLDMETGTGLITGQGSDPIITLNISDNRGRTWSSDLPASMGPMGHYGRSVEWRGMGQFRSRVHKFRISDPVKVALIALYADIA